MPVQTPQSFDDFSDKYHETLSECLRLYGGRDAQYYNRLKAKRLIELARKHLGDLSKRDFLDLGCGTGLTAEIISPAFRRGAGVDLSHGMLRACHARLGSNPLPNCRFAQASVADLPFPGGSFDLAFSVTLIHHLPDDAIWKMFADVRRVLKPGGLMVHFDHNPYNFLTRRIVENCVYDKDTALRPMSRVASLAEETGFRIADRGYLIFIPGALKFLEPLEYLFKPIPLGGQYYFSAKPL